MVNGTFIACTGPAKFAGCDPLGLVGFAAVTAASLP
jgi:hypothetical protein